MQKSWLRRRRRSNVLLPVLYFTTTNIDSTRLAIKTVSRTHTAQVKRTFCDFTQSKIFVFYFVFAGCILTLLCFVLLYTQYYSSYAKIQDDWTLFLKHQGGALAYVRGISLSELSWALETRSKYCAVDSECDSDYVCGLFAPGARMRTKSYPRHGCRLFLQNSLTGWKYVTDHTRLEAEWSNQREWKRD